MPTPKWKLVVDIGSAPPKLDEKVGDRRIPDTLKLLAENIPTHRSSPFSPYLPGFTGLRLLLLKRNRTPEDNDLVNTMLDSYSSYLSSGRNSSETAWMVARDFMLLTQTSNQHNPVMPNTLQPIHQQPSTQQQQQQQRAPQFQQQPLQQQLTQVHSVANLQQQHSVVPPTQHIQQLHTNQYQQIETIQRPHQSMLQQQQNAVTAPSVQIAAPAIHSGHGSSASLVNHIRPPVSNGQDGLSSLGHFTTHVTQNGQNHLSQNGIAALSHLAQQHQITHTNGISPLPNDKNGVPGI